MFTFWVNRVQAVMRIPFWPCSESCGIDLNHKLWAALVYVKQIALTLCYKVAFFMHNACWFSVFM